MSLTQWFSPGIDSQAFWELDPIFGTTALERHWMRLMHWYIALLSKRISHNIGEKYLEDWTTLHVKLMLITHICQWRQSSFCKLTCWIPLLFLLCPCDPHTTAFVGGTHPEPYASFQIHSRRWRMSVTVDCAALDQAMPSAKGSSWQPGHGANGGMRIFTTRSNCVHPGTRTRGWGRETRARELICTVG